MSYDRKSLHGMQETASCQRVGDILKRTNSKHVGVSWEDGSHAGPTEEARGAGFN